ncbi:low molecular weight phosphatase family protein [Arenibacter amylolyticus]|uniref:protein-tyrosine-phosphatase n=1 Tax=Arenibacter amylolyticus TaxID=1406873 RepID=UPI000A36603B|nr:protein-tyrosine-phosphatase [Arenibacter amylolyticus]
MVFNKIKAFLECVDLKSIPEDRKMRLQSLIDHLKSQMPHAEIINLNFICTHNSRRSHLSQVWAQVMAYHFQYNKIQCYSGGTEATAIFPMVINTLENTGFVINKLSEGTNPIYAIKYAPNQLPIIGFSKAFDHSFNPISQFTAVMTCSEANEACPVITGTENRISLTYEDPKLFDDTSLQEEKYLERSTQIATELYYVFSNLR